MFKNQVLLEHITAFLSFVFSAGRYEKGGGGVKLKEDVNYKGLSCPMTAFDVCVNM